MLTTPSFALSIILAAIGLQPTTTAPKAPDKPAPQKAVESKPVKAAEKPATPAANPAVTPVDRKEDWWVARNDSFNGRVKEGHEKGDIGMVFIGDSITQGWEGAGKDVWASYYAKRNAVNLGIGGDRTQHVIWRMEHGNLDGLAKPVKGEAPKLAVIMIGTNNSGDSSAEQIAAGIEGVVGKVREKLPAAKILVLAIFPREEKPGELRAKVAAASELAKKVADNKTVYFMDIGATFMNEDKTLSKEIMPDSLHLSAEGYSRWAKAIEPKVKELLGEK